LKTLTWILKYVVFPLLPFFFGAATRCLYLGNFQFASLSPAELAFSMALLTLIISVSTSRLDNKDLRDALTQAFQLGAIVYIALFSWAIFLETDLGATRAHFVTVVQQQLAANTPFLAQGLPAPNASFEAILSRLRWITVCLSAVMIPLAVFTTCKYDLEKV
jgi:hypothetical protein